MKVKELIEKLKDINGEKIITVIKQHDSEYQEMFGINYLNTQHPVGGLCIHLVKLSDKQAQE